MFTLYKKELQYYLNNPVGYIVIVLFAVFANFFFVKDIFMVGSASLRPFFVFLPWLFMIFLPAIAMRSIAEEKRTNTIETLLTLPISETQIVLAKFLALLTVTAIGLVLTLGLPVSLYVITRQYYTGIYIPEVIVAYIGALCFASAGIALSMFFSSQTKNQVVAFLGSALCLFFLIVLATDFVGSQVSKEIQDAINYVTPMNYLQAFIKGVIDLRSVFYFIGFTVLFLFLTIIDLEKRG
jgi:ABC-2 type transport system permease protein